ncbi:MAG: carotenoid biosynthesis protein [Lunatimonas sp.]|uniref:carotenoid biosynthesis protein n=1 Tax=Lunatimonas sp. TaxID=2060141 RepID=UPI00263B7672|nr:carotenoid biosynthesis protein [Lunatimonas sp.]MCC5937583.1 carotenoid biosynthesis protein [Lunatimonas sp.]
MRNNPSPTISFGAFSIEKTLVFKLWIGIFHLVGVLGLYVEFTRTYFQTLTPLHLLMCAGILLYFHTDWSKGFWWFAIAAFGIGMLAEIIGVQTGLLFGDYQYGPVLGPKLAGVPLIIGVNWFILAYSAGQLSRKFIRSNWGAAAVAAALMVVLDFVIEPVAVQLDFWTWEQGDIPVENYLGWFAVAFSIQLLYQKLSFDKQNPISTFLLLNLFLFFSILVFIL